MENENMSVEFALAMEYANRNENIAVWSVTKLREYVSNETGIPFSDVSGLGYVKASETLKPLLIAFCEFAVSKDGLAFQAGIETLRVYIPRAFPSITHCSVRFSRKESDLKPTKAYSGKGPVVVNGSRYGSTSSTGETERFQCQIALKEQSAKPDFLQPTLDVVENPGNAPGISADQLEHQAKLSGLDKLEIGERQLIAQANGSHGYGEQSTVPGSKYLEQANLVDSYISEYRKMREARDYWRARFERLEQSTARKAQARKPAAKKAQARKPAAKKAIA